MKEATKTSHKKTQNQLVAGTAAAVSNFGLFFSNKDPVRIDPDSVSDFSLNAPNDWTNENR